MSAGDQGRRPNPTQGPIPDQGIALHGAVRGDGKPFVVIYVDGEPYGQLAPSEAIAHGTRAVQAAIEAERDAAIVIACIETAAAAGEPESVGQERAAGLLNLIRRHRPQHDPDPGQAVPPSSRPREEG